MSYADQLEVRAALRERFPKEQIGRLPRTEKRPALDFVGHAAVTDRLNKIAPDWSYTIDQTFQVGESFWLRGTMTIGGVSRPEYGDGDDPKEAIGNFIRRGAMRFGVAIDLWSREELEASEAPRSGRPKGKGHEVPGTSGDTSTNPSSVGGQGAGAITGSSAPSLATEHYCGRRGCGHIRTIHRPKCEGIRVVGEPNIPGADQPCRCQSFVDTSEDGKASDTSAATTVSNAGVRPADDAAPGEVPERVTSPSSTASPGSGPKKYVRNPDTLQLEEVS